MVPERLDLEHVIDSQFVTCESIGTKIVADVFAPCYASPLLGPLSSLVDELELIAAGGRPSARIALMRGDSADSVGGPRDANASAGIGQE